MNNQVDEEVDWDQVHLTNFCGAAFNAIKWIWKAKDICMSARELEPRVADCWIELEGGGNPADYYSGVYFMLISFAVENLLKGALVNCFGYRMKRRFLFRVKKKRNTKPLPRYLTTHELVKLARRCKLELSSGEEDLLRRLTRSAMWSGRYPSPLKYVHMSGIERFRDGKEYGVSWFGSDDVERLKGFINSLPERLGLGVHFVGSPLMPL